MTNQEKTKDTANRPIHFLVGFPLMLFLILFLQAVSFNLGSYFFIGFIVIYALTIALIVAAYKKGHRRFANGALISLAIAFLLTVACFGLLASTL